MAIFANDAARANKLFASVIALWPVLRALRPKPPS
jgi:hypothetical protein